MTDPDKVVKGLECCANKQSCNGCPYFCYNARCQDDMNRDALMLIKKQKEEIAFLKGMQRQTVKGMDEVELGEKVGRMLGIIK